MAGLQVQVGHSNSTPSLSGNIIGLAADRPQLQMSEIALASEPTIVFLQNASDRAEVAGFPLREEAKLDFKRAFISGEQLRAAA